MKLKPCIQDIQDFPQVTTPLGGYARTLVNQPHLRLVNLQLDAGEKVLEHTVPVEVVFLILAGHGTVLIEAEAYEVSAGQMLICPSNCSRSLQAADDERLSLLVVRAPNPANDEG